MIKDTLLTAEALAQELGITPRTVSRMVARQQLPRAGLTIGRKHYWHRDTVAAHLHKLAQGLTNNKDERA